MLAAFYSISRAEGEYNTRGEKQTEVRKHRERGGGTCQIETHTLVHSYRDTIGPIWGCCQQGHRGERKQDDFSSASFHHTAMTPLFTSAIYLHTGCLPPCLAVCVYRPCVCARDYQHINSDGVGWAGHCRLWSTAWEHAVRLVNRNPMFCLDVGNTGNHPQWRDSGGKLTVVPAPRFSRQSRRLIPL